MNLLDILHRAPSPIPWQEGDNIPWHEPGFSARMLAEHLTQSHDRASRRSHIIDQHVAWIHDQLLHGNRASILDLGCGPGLYSNRLAALGHRCRGIDFSPASITYAHEKAQLGKLSATYLHDDIRQAEYGSGYGLAMLLFGELNVFSKTHATAILSKAFAALQPGGLLLLEPHIYASLIPDPHGTTTWFSSPGGLFSPRPHLVLMENLWDAALAIVTRRYYIIDAETAEVTRFAQSMQTYTEAQYQALITSIGFTDVEILPGLAHDRITPEAEFHAIVARKPT